MKSRGKANRRPAKPAREVAAKAHLRPGGKPAVKRGRNAKPARSTKGRVPSKPAAKIRNSASKGPPPVVSVTTPHPPAVKPAKAPLGPSAEKQQKLYEEAVRLFNAKQFEQADALFQQAQHGPNRTLAHHAQVHSAICRQRLKPPQVTLKTAEDHYNYAVTLINARQLPEAAGHLKTALEMAPKADHIHYALAAAQALLGNPQAAYEQLRAAIELEPRNRALARADADFASTFTYPPMASLLQLERGAPRIIDGMSGTG